jgi:hypothetical protein
MPFCREPKGISTPKPQVGQYGILDQEDLDAWKKVSRPFDDLGLTLLRQLGMGEFGRVYEALNHTNPHIPERVAIKVDRIQKGEKKQAILAAEQTMQIGRDLALSPHVIRIYDAGKLKGKKYTYHVLQLVDGDTLDNLVGVVGEEHSSVRRPESARRSADDVQREFLQSVRRSAGESWRRRRAALRFTEALSLSQLLDLLTSILLWVEEIHTLGYAVNDLKNGNLMVSRRGQLKGIDMDPYSRVVTSLDKLPDFFFLAASLLLLIVKAQPAENSQAVNVERTLSSRDNMWAALRQSWSYGDVARISHGRVETSDVINLLVDLIRKSRNRTYSTDAEVFRQDIDRLIRLKRTVFIEEIVLD